MMTILVTGGAGYIGSHAVRLLCEAGYKVWVLDNLSTGHRQAVHSEVLSQGRFIQGAISESEKIEALVREQKIEAVLHFAAHIEVGESVQNPEKYYTNNFSSAVKLIQAALNGGLRKFVFSSTAAVYGNPIRVPIDEEHPLAPLSPYGKSKAMVESALADFAHSHGLGYAVLRYFNVAGAHPDASIGEDHQPESHLIPRILQAALKEGLTLSVYGNDYPTPDGTCVRDYVHVLDLARAHLLALEAIQPASGKTFNIGSQSGFSVLEVVEVCKKVTGLDIPTVIHGRRAGDASTLVASRTKIQTQLGWQPQFPDLETIVTHAWAWHKKNPGGYAND
jgi:UDP-glucose 4-epimerase